MKKVLFCFIATAGIAMAADPVSFPPDAPEHLGMSRAALAS